MVAAGDVVAREALLLALREVIVLVLVVAVLLWVGCQFVRGGRRQASKSRRSRRPPRHRSG